jgi:hypothetical protein
MSNKPKAVVDMFHMCEDHRIDYIAKHAMGARAS